LGQQHCRPCPGRRTVGTAAFVAHYRKTVDDGLAGLQGQRPGVIFEYDNSIRLPAMSLKDIYQARGDAASYAALCDRMWVPLRRLLRRKPSTPTAARAEFRSSTGERAHHKKAEIAMKSCCILSGPLCTTYS
jgi:hypothetical protein